MMYSSSPPITWEMKKCKKLTQSYSVELQGVVWHRARLAQSDYILIRKTLELKLSQEEVALSLQCKQITFPLVCSEPTELNPQPEPSANIPVQIAHRHSLKLNPILNNAIRGKRA